MRRGPVRYAGHPVRRAVARGLFRLLQFAALAAAAVAVAPVTLVAAGSAAFGWWRGWPPRRLFTAAAWCLPMAAVWLAAIAAWPLHAARAPGPTAAARAALRTAGHASRAGHAVG